jgi:hypothetical protein
MNLKIDYYIFDLFQKINQTANGEDKEENDQEKEVQDKDMAL